MTGKCIAIIGATGMLGRELVGACQRHEIEALPIVGPDDLDITDASAIGRTLSDPRIDVVINAAAYTDVDGAESDPRMAFRINHEGAAHLAWQCRRLDALLVHYSTDYVFPGDARRAYPVDAPTGPINVYGLSKLTGERAVRGSGCQHLIVRTSWLFAPHGNNFVRTILRLAQSRSELEVVSDQIGRPTSCRDLAEMTLNLILHGARGTFHAANGGTCSWYGLAREILHLTASKCTLRSCPTTRFPRPAARPRYSVLDLSRTRNLIGPIPTWRTALEKCIDDLRPPSDNHVETASPGAESLAASPT